MSSRHPGRIRQRIRNVMEVYAALLLGWITAIIVVSLYGQGAQNMWFFLAVASVTFTLLCGAITIMIYQKFSALIAWYEALLDALPCAVIALDAESHWLYTNERTLTLLNVSINDGGIDSVLRGISLPDTPKQSVVQLSGREHLLTISGLKAGAAPIREHALCIMDISSALRNSATKDDASLVELLEIKKRVNSASSSFMQAASSLAQCTRRQAELIATMTSAMARYAEEGSDREAIYKSMGIAAALMKETALKGAGHFDEIQESLHSLRSETTKNTIEYRGYN